MPCSSQATRSAGMARRWHHRAAILPRRGLDADTHAIATKEDRMVGDLDRRHAVGVAHGQPLVRIDRDGDVLRPTIRRSFGRRPGKSNSAGPARDLPPAPTTRPDTG